MLALSLVTYITFFTAYSSPAKAARVNINNYGEADIEMLMLSILLPLNIFSTVMISRKLSERKEEMPMEMSKNKYEDNYGV